jgi:hypothetical protein
MASNMVPVATGVVKFMTDKGYKEVKKEDCDILKQRYTLEKTIQLYVAEPNLIKHVNSIVMGDHLDENGQLRPYVSYKLNNILGDKKKVDADASVCTIFQAIAGSPSQSKESFRGALTMWKKNGVFGGDKAALVYSPTVGPTVSGSGDPTRAVLESAEYMGATAATAAVQEAPEETKKSNYLGAGFATVLILSVLGLSLAFYFKNRNKRREEEEELSRPD